jgi:hypothetical protein
MAGNGVKLTDTSGGGSSSTKTTASDSSATFTGLANLGTYTADISSVKAGFEKCSTAVTKTLAPGTAYPLNIELAVRPLCSQEDRRDYLGTYGDYLGTYGDYLGTYADYLGTYADPFPTNWNHTGFDARHEGWPTSDFEQWEGGQYVHYRWHSELGPNSPSGSVRGWFYERWVANVYAHYGGAYAHYGGAYAHYGGAYAHYGPWYKVWVCPT